MVITSDRALGWSRTAVAYIQEDSIESTATIINQNGKNVSIHDWYANDLKFTDILAKKLQDFMKNSPQTSYCGLQGTIDADGKQSNQTDGILIKLNGSIPIARPYIETSPACSSSSVSQVGAPTGR